MRTRCVCSPVHGAKGLEFPIVILTGWGSKTPSHSQPILGDPVSQRVEIGLGAGEEKEWATVGYRDAARREKSLGEAEGIRLSYVAATRARDHLIVSLFRKIGADVQGEAFEGAFQTFAGAVPVMFGDRSPREPEAAAPDAGTPEENAAAERAWAQRRAADIATRSGLRPQTATGLAHDEAADPPSRAEEAAIRRRGRGATALGRAVHAVLQTVDLATLADLEIHARAQAEAEGIAERTSEVAKLVRAAASLEPVRRAVAGGRFWREVPVGGPIEGGTLEGVVDLLYEDGKGGFIVLDYKTDAISASEIDERLERYRPQGEAYAILVEAATKKRVSAVIFAFAAIGAWRSNARGQHALRERSQDDIRISHRKSEEANGGGRTLKISTVLDHIDSGHMALPEFQRGYVWNRDQVRALFDSLYRRHPVGGLLVWATESKTATHRGDGPLAPGVVKLLLDGQQRMTTLYGVVRGRAPEFFDGNAQAFTGLRFHLDTETFAFYQPVKMQDDPLWIDVTELMKRGPNGLGALVTHLSAQPAHSAKIGDYVGRLSQLLGITEVDLYVEEVTGADKTLDVVVDIFNRVNSGGTKLSKGDLALAKIGAEWPEARDTMKVKLKEWETANFHFNLDWLLRSVNTALTGEAKFQFLHDKSAEDVQDGLKRATKHIDTSLNLISGRLGLDHDQVFFGRFGVPVMVRYLDRRTKPMNEKERDKLLFWFAEAGMWGRFSGSTETFIDQDLAALEGADDGLDRLLDQLRLWHGGLRVEPGHFTGWSLGARFYPVLYLLTRMGGACDWGTGLPLKANLLGKMSRLEVHHIFPKAQLYKRKFKRPEVNALGNFCFLTKDTNLDISDRLPEEYFPEVERAHPGALATQWIPTDPALWKIENYRAFLEARKVLLAAEANRRMEELLHGDTRWLTGPPAALPAVVSAARAVGSDAEEAEIEALNEWMKARGLPPGTVSYDFADPETGQQRAVFDLAWPSGIQEELSEPVAVLLNEGNETIATASQSGFRCFTDITEFQNYVETEILTTEP